MLYFIVMSNIYFSYIVVLEHNDQVKYKISHHSLKKNECSITSSKELVFVLDEPSDEPPRKKQKNKTGSKEKDAAMVTIKNFGSTILIPKFKSSSILKVAWRCRLDSQADGAKLLMPVRPVAILTGSLEVLDGQNVSLM